jgi:hypothetical protein
LREFTVVAGFFHGIVHPVMNSVEMTPCKK